MRYDVVVTLGLLVCGMFLAGTEWGLPAGAFLMGFGLGRVERIFQQGE